MAARKISTTPRRASSTKRAPATIPSFSEEPELSRAEARELERRVSDLNDRTRYMIVSVLDANFVLYYNVSEDTYGWNDPSHATLFKRKKAAQIILELVGDKDALIACEVNKRGQLIKKTVSLPKSRGRARSAPKTSKRSKG